MSSPAHGAVHRTEDPQDGADDDQHDADRVEDPDAQHQAEDQQYETKKDHGLLLPAQGPYRLQSGNAARRTSTVGSPPKYGIVTTWCRAPGSGPPVWPSTVRPSAERSKPTKPFSRSRSSARALPVTVFTRNAARVFWPVSSA